MDHKKIVNVVALKRYQYQQKGKNKGKILSTSCSADVGKGWGNRSTKYLKTGNDVLSDNSKNFVPQMALFLTDAIKKNQGDYTFYLNRLVSPKKKIRTFLYTPHYNIWPWLKLNSNLKLKTNLFQCIISDLAKVSGKFSVFPGKDPNPYVWGCPIEFLR